MSPAINRVGARQWRILSVALENENGLVSDRQAVAAVGGNLSPAHVRKALESMERRGYLAHCCADAEHKRGPLCLYRITDAGGDVRLGRHGDWRDGRRKAAALAA